MSYTLATAKTPGFGILTQSTTGKKFVACVCVIEWFPLFEKMMLIRKFIKHSVDIIQIVGGDPDSAGTHLQGAAIDMEQVGDGVVALARAAGANASWSRYPPAFSNDHTHMVLTGCPHDGPCHYQTVAQAEGYNGLGYKGRGGRDPYPKNVPYRDFKQGIAWMKQEIEAWRIANMPAVSTKTVMTSDTPTTIRRVNVGLYAQVTKGAQGKVTFQWKSGSNWLNISSIGVGASGYVGITNAPWHDVEYRAVFTSADPKKWTNSVSNSVAVAVIQPDDLRKLLN